MDILRDVAFEVYFKTTEIYKREVRIRKADILLFSENFGYFNIVANEALHLWKEAKAQAVPEGFVLVPKELSDEVADELASDAFNNAKSLFDSEYRGYSALQREHIRLRWCKRSAKQYQSDYKAMIEVQEQSHE